MKDSSHTSSSMLISGKFQVHVSSRPADHRTNTITVEDDVSSWNVGDDIVIASTDFDFEQAERFKIVSVSGRDVTISGDLSTFLTKSCY